MMSEGTISHADAAQTHDLVLRVTAVVSEIDALKRERTANPTRHARVELGAIYFNKRMRRESERTNVARR
jgi:hypothetical protein